VSGGKEDEEEFFRNFLSKHKIDIFIGDKKKRRCFNAQLKICDFFFFAGKKSNRHNSFHFSHNETLSIHGV
jgi:hypothetical protein